MTNISKEAMKDCCDIEFPPISNECPPCSNNDNFRVSKNRMYRNDKFYGMIIKKSGNELTVKVESRNKYMNGQIIKFYQTK